MSEIEQDERDALRKQVQAGNAFYLGVVERDLANGRLFFEIVGDPHKGEVVRTLTFIGVRDFREEWFEEPDPFYKRVIGLDRYRQEQGTLYVIHMTQSEMFFHGRRADCGGNGGNQMK